MGRTRAHEAIPLLRERGRHAAPFDRVGRVLPCKIGKRDGVSARHRCATSNSSSEEFAPSGHLPAHEVWPLFSLYETPSHGRTDRTARRRLGLRVRELARRAGLAVLCGEGGRAGTRVASVAASEDNVAAGRIRVDAAAPHSLQRARARAAEPVLKSTFVEHGGHAAGEYLGAGCSEHGWRSQETVGVSSS